MKVIMDDKLPRRCSHCLATGKDMPFESCRICQDQGMKESFLCNLCRNASDSSSFQCHAFRPYLTLVGKGAKQSDDISICQDKKGYFAEVVKEVCSRNDFVVILIGDSFDSDACQSVENIINMDTCIKLAGKISSRQFAFLVERASLVLSNDSATMHLANFYSRPVIGIFGPTDAEKYAYLL